MILHDCVQGSSEWHRLKLGIPSASQFGRILTAGGKPSTQAKAYLYQLLAEHFLGEPSNADASAFMSRGTALEDAARKRFAFDNDIDVRQVGVCLRDDGLVAASPDGLVGDDALLEIKVPSASTHIAYLMGGLDGEYWSQCQGQLYVTERKRVHLYAWNPTLPPASIAVPRDEAYIELLDNAVSAFVREMLAARVRLIDLGCSAAGKLLIPAHMVTDPTPF